jgi:hypothetical protein
MTTTTTAAATTNTTTTAAATSTTNTTNARNIATTTRPKQLGRRATTGASCRRAVDVKSRTQAKLTSGAGSQGGMSPNLAIRYGKQAIAAFGLVIWMLPSCRFTLSATSMNRRHRSSFG